MLYKFIDSLGTFIVQKPHQYPLYFPLADAGGKLLSCITANLAGDIKRDNEHFLTPPASIEDLRSNLLCRRDFFLKTGKEIIRLSYPYQDTLEAGFLYHKLTKKVRALEIEILNFIPYNLGVEVMWVKVKNSGKRPIKITPISFIPLYGRPEKNLRDHRHVTSLLNRISLDRYGIYLKPTLVFDERRQRKNKDIYFVLGFADNKIAPLGQYPTLDYFYGRGDAVFPEAIEKDRESVKRPRPEFSGREACSAFRFKERWLKREAEANYFLIMGIEAEVSKIKEIFRRLDSPQKIKESLRGSRQYWLRLLGKIDFDFQNKTLNNWLLWVKLQPILRKLFGCSFLPHFDYGKGGRGWRDLWQDILTLLLIEPEKARDVILRNFSGVRIDGSNATIITREGNFISDRNRISRVWMDHGVWPYLTLRLYIHKTADLNILLEETTYFRDSQLKRAQQIDTGFAGGDYLLRHKNQRVYRGTILEHILIQNLVQFFNVGGHNIIRLENADWNDGLDMAAQAGESVAFSFMYAHNLKDLISLLEKLKEQTDKIAILEELKLLLDRIGKPINYSRYQEKQKRLKEYLAKSVNISGRKIKVKIDDLIRDLQDKSSHMFSWLREKEWLGRYGFFNGYYDNRLRRVEGKQGRRIRMMLPSQVFAIMSGCASPGQIKKIWISLKKHLQDKKLKGFRLNTDFNSLYLDLGRAFGFAYGEKENGAFFNHMVVMLGHALYKRGFVREGYAVINSLYQMSISASAEIYPMLPEYFNSAGRGLYHYLTGSASWYIYTLIEEILGIKFFFGDIILEPKLLPDNFSGRRIEVKFGLSQKVLRVVFLKTTKEDKLYEIKEVFLEKRKISPGNGKYILKQQVLKRFPKKELLLEVRLG